MRKSKNYWTKELCYEAALKYETKRDFKKYNNSAYQACIKLGVLNDVTKHMKLLRVPNGYWTKDRCHEVALKYSGRWQFQRLAGNVYLAAFKLGVIDDICEHMDSKVSLLDRLVYVFEFDDNSAYIGLTNDIEQRLVEHKTNSNSAIRNKLQKSNYVLKQLTDYVPKDQASQLEKKYIDQYIKNGWEILNQAKGGSLGGGSKKWSLKKIQILIKSEGIENANQLCKKYSGAVNYLKRKKLLDVCFPVKSTIKTKPDGYWTKERCHEVALKYNNLKDFLKNYGGAYSSAYRNGWLNEITNHMVKGYKKKK